MRRRLFNFTALVSAVLCMATASLWMRSLAHFEDVEARFAPWPGNAAGRSLYIEFAWYSNTLRLYVISNRYPPGLRSNDPPGWDWRFQDEFQMLERIEYDSGFQFRHGTQVFNPPDAGWGSSTTDWVIGVRPWLPTLLFALLPAMWVRRFVKLRLRRREGLCHTCGYDLRATPDRCPECGAAAKSPHNPPMQRTATASSGAVQ